MNKYYRWLIPVGLVAFTILVWLLKDLVRNQFEIPLTELANTLNLVYVFVPQWVWWALVLAAAYWIAFLSLQRPKDSSMPASPETKLKAEERVTTLARWVANCHRPYYRYRINQTLADLLAEVFATKMHTTPYEIKKAIRQEKLDLPDDIAPYFKKGLNPMYTIPSRYPFWVEMLLGIRETKETVIKQVDAALVYLEEELEVFEK